MRRRIGACCAYCPSRSLVQKIGQASPVVVPHIYNGRSKSFFYGAFEGWRHPAQTTLLETVPSTLMKTGDFSKYTATGFTGLNYPFTGGSYGTSIPKTALEKLAIRVQLERLLSNPYFSHSRRFPSFLRYIVNATLNGHADALKERTLGIEIFGKSAVYDTALDPIVRVTAGEIRKRIAQYYQVHPPLARYLPNADIYRGSKYPGPIKQQYGRKLSRIDLMILAEFPYRGNLSSLVGSGGNGLCGSVWYQ